MFSSPSPPPYVAPAQPTSAPSLQPPNKKPEAKVTQPSFVGAALEPQQGQLGQKTLLGGG